MSSKNKSSSIKQRDKKVMDLGQKLKILEMLESNEKIAEIARKFKVNESTIRSIRGNKEKIYECSKKLGAHAQVLKICRSASMEKMEEMLMVWIQDLVHKKIPISTKAIREQALVFHEKLKEASNLPNNTKNFSASKGWFEKFKTRYGLQSLNFSGESAPIDHEIAQNFISKDIGEEGFVDAQANEFLELIHPEAEEIAVVEEDDVTFSEQSISANEKKADENSETSESFTLKDLSSMINLVETAVAQAVQDDPVISRSLKFKHDCDIAVQPYRDLYKSLVRVNQTRIDQYFSAK